MGDKSWKAFERRVAAWFPNGRRRGPDTRDAHAGKSDVICDDWSPECAVLERGSLNYSKILAKVLQSERNAEPGKIPVTIVKAKHAEDRDALVVFRAEVFRSLILARHEYLSEDEDEDEAPPGSTAGYPRLR